MANIEGMQSLYNLRNDKYMNQFRLIMLIFTVFTYFAARELLHAPILGSMLFGGFWLFPLFASYSTAKDAKLAVEAFEGGIKKPVKAIWVVQHYDNSTTCRAKLSSEDDKIWFVELTRGGDEVGNVFTDEMSGAESDVNVWVHPKTGGPHLLEYEDRYFPLMYKKSRY